MRIRVFLLALVGVLLVCLPLFGVEEASFLVGIFALQDDSNSLLQLVREAGSTYADQFIVPSDEYGQHLFEKWNIILELSRLKSISSAYASKSEKDLEKAKEAILAPAFSQQNRLSVIYEEIPYHEGYAKLLNNFSDSRSWYASQNNLDALLLLKKTKIASNDRIRLYWYDVFSDTTTMIFDKVSLTTDFSEMQEEVGSALLTRTVGKEYGLLVFDNYNSSLVVEANGEPLPVKGSQAVLPTGEHLVSLSRDGYTPRQVQLDILPNAITHIGTTLQHSDLGDIHFSSSMGRVNWYVDGDFLENRCDLSLNASLLPLVVVAQKEGFASKTLQVHKAAKEIEVSLKPEWMTQALLIQEEQRAFYKSLRNTMLVFGLYVASSTLSSTFDMGNPLWQPLQIATSGFALVSTLHTIMNLVSYASLASSGVR